MTCISCAMLRYELGGDKAIHLAFAHCFYCPVLLILYVQHVAELKNAICFTFLFVELSQNISINVNL